jgi:hypothetical protein
VWVVSALSIYHPLVCVSIPMSGHTVLITVAVQYTLKSVNLCPSSLFLFLKVVLAIVGPLFFHMYFGLSLHVSIRNPPGIRNSETWYHYRVFWLMNPIYPSIYKGLYFSQQQFFYGFMYELAHLQKQLFEWLYGNKFTYDTIHIWHYIFIVCCL